MSRNENKNRKCVRIKIGNMSNYVLDIRGYFEISVFEILKIDCTLLCLHLRLFIYNSGELL